MKNSAEHFIIQKAEKGDKKRIHNAVDMRTGKNQSLIFAEDLSIPSVSSLKYLFPGYFCISAALYSRSFMLVILCWHIAAFLLVNLP